MEKEKVKGIPYGVANFEQLRQENSYYVDKTMYLPLLEDMGNYLFLIRPRRFGKSRIRQHDAGVLRHCQSRPVRYAV